MARGECDGTEHPGGPRRSQATTKGHFNDRFARIRQRPELLLWLRCGNAAEIHGWYQRTDGHWRVRRVELVPVFQYFTVLGLLAYFLCDVIRRFASKRDR